MGGRHNFHAPERIMEICSEMRNHGVKMTAFANEIESLFEPIAKARLASREYSRSYMRQYRLLHPEYREMCRESARRCNERKRAEMEAQKLQDELMTVHPASAC